MQTDSSQFHFGILFLLGNLVAESPGSPAAASGGCGFAVKIIFIKRSFMRPTSDISFILWKSYGPFFCCLSRCRSTYATLSTVQFGLGSTFKKLTTQSLYRSTLQRFNRTFEDPMCCQKRKTTTSANSHIYNFRASLKQIPLSVSLLLF